MISVFVVVDFIANLNRILFVSFRSLLKKKVENCTSKPILPRHAIQQREMGDRMSTVRVVTCKYQKFEFIGFVEIQGYRPVFKQILLRQLSC